MAAGWLWRRTLPYGDADKGETDFLRQKSQQMSVSEGFPSKTRTQMGKCSVYELSVRVGVRQEIGRADDQHHLLVTVIPGWVLFCQVSNKILNSLIDSIVGSHRKENYCQSVTLKSDDNPIE